MSLVTFIVNTDMTLGSHLYTVDVSIPLMTSCFNGILGYILVRYTVYLTKSTDTPNRRFILHYHEWPQEHDLVIIIFYLLIFNTCQLQYLLISYPFLIISLKINWQSSWHSWKIAHSLTLVLFKYQFPHSLSNLVSSKTFFNRACHNASPRYKNTFCSVGPNRHLRREK